MDNHDIERLLLLVEQLPGALPAHCGQASPIHGEKHRIDLAITKLEDVLCTLKRKSNSLALIHRLSSDILLHIFAYVQTVDKPEDWFVVDPFERHVGLTNHMVWIREITHICSRWRSLAVESPVLWTDVQLHQELESILEARIHQMKSLELHIPRVWYEQFVCRLLSQATSLLETCICRVWPTTASIHGITLPLQLLEISANSLRHLELSNCAFESRLQPIHLPRLSTLSIQAMASEHVINTLQVISLPETCNVTLDCWVQGSFWESKAKAGTPLTTIGVGLRGDGPILTVNSSDENKVSKLCITFRFWTINMLADLLGQLWTAYPLEALSLLSLRLNTDIDWSFFAHQCPNLRELYVGCDGVEQLFRLMDTGYDDGTPVDTEDTTPRFTKLNAITFMGISFSEELGRRFVECCKRRSEMGLPIRNLTFRGRCCHRWMLEELDIEGKLVCDGCESDAED
ncbi:hypothetical protein BDN72DRAFT_836444 [Pluteus cervinus]|uniref:Uncharacterized protein n=1 Tax=Pluteus cervinus TaxID=181527 RepID=A0ACD3B3R2_9AGAR|nr:hypothetical protein BDN72DRAFT_836444 [Pluteus cervinus]